MVQQAYLQSQVQVSEGCHRDKDVDLKLDIERKDVKQFENRIG